MSVDSQLEQNQWEIENTSYIGDAYPICSPNLGPDVFTACMGFELEFGQDTSWVIHDQELCNPDNYKALKIQQENIYYKKIKELTEAYCEHGKGKYFVGITDLHPGADSLVAMRSPEQLCYDAIEDPDFIKQASMDIFGEFKSIYSELCEMTESYQQGTSNWMGVWHEKRQYVTGCDFSYMISTEMYRELIVDELKAELDYLDASIYHVDGVGVLKHIDVLLEMEKLKGIQWVYGAGQPTAAHWIKDLQKIQEAGKTIHIDAYPSDVLPLINQLKPEGLYINLVGGTKAEAEELFSIIDKK